MASGVQKLVNKVKSGAREFADSLTPTLKVSSPPFDPSPSLIILLATTLQHTHTHTHTYTGLPVHLQESKFKESGMITAEEFVVAGDYLVYHCPTWSW